MENELSQVQAVRPVNKDCLDSVDSTPVPKIMHFDCHVDPTTKKGFVLWDDIRLVFPDALYVRNQTKVVPFMKGVDFMPLQPLRIATMPDVVLDVVVDGLLVRTEAAASQGGSSQTTIQDSTKKSTMLDVHGYAPITGQTTTIRRNPVYGHEVATMSNYLPRAPQYITSSKVDYSSDDESADSLALIHEQPAANGPSIHIKPPQAPQDQTAAVDVKDISSIVVKATLGDANSQVQLGDMHKVGDNVEQDYEAARYWYLKAANQGHASAQCSVGDLYRLGLGIDFNHSTALSWYQKAADQGDAAGQYNLGFMYEYGLALEMDYAAAMDWYRKSADQGHAFARSFIGDLHYRGHGVPKDYSKALEWYLLAAKQGLSWAHYSVGLLYLHGQGVPKDEDVALEWFHKAISCRGTDSRDHLFMGVLYLEGLGIPQDYSKAHEWFLKSARQGLPEAQVRIAYLYRAGYGISQDLSEAMKWFRKAADQLLPDAQLNIGLMYFMGYGVPKHYSIAKDWCIKASRE